MTSPDIRQSEEFALFMKDLGWDAEKFSGQYVYLKKFPLIGRFAKCPRPDYPLKLSGISDFLRKKKVFHFKIAPNITGDLPQFKKEKDKLVQLNFRIDKDPFNPTTTLRINLQKKEEEIFKSFSEAKRRGVRRAIKHGVIIEPSYDIDIFIKIRQEHFFPMGFLINKEMQMLWKNFYPQSCDLLLAKTARGKFVAGILLLYCGKIAYYWFAAAIPEGKRLFAPTLLVWEAVKTAKKHGCHFLDFEGIYDERFPKASESWRGFTKFKEGFSDNKIVFMENFYLRKSIFGNIW